MQEAKAVGEDELPLTLPPTQDFKPSGRSESPLAKITDWVQTTDPATGPPPSLIHPVCHLALSQWYHSDVDNHCNVDITVAISCTLLPCYCKSSAWGCLLGGPATRETCTMPQWAGSCWYYLRFIDPTNSQRMLDGEAEKYWMPVDLYVGGAEHAVLHLLYARFWHKVTHSYCVFQIALDCLYLQTIATFLWMSSQVGMLLTCMWCMPKGHCKLFSWLEPAVTASKPQLSQGTIACTGLP